MVTRKIDHQKAKQKQRDATMLDLYRQGLTYPKIGDRIGMTAEGVQARIRTLKQHVKKQEPTRSLEELELLRNRIRELREEGKDMWAIGRAIGITKPQVYRHLQAMGLI
jgi:hypothetical protein